MEAREHPALEETTSQRYESTLVPQTHGGLQKEKIDH
jgi:hypothetical protein